MDCTMNLAFLEAVPGTVATELKPFKPYSAEAPEAARNTVR